MSSGSNENQFTSDESVNASGDLSLEKKEEEDPEADPAVLILPVDDFPDGGLAAWFIVLGVSLESTIPFLFFDEKSRSARVPSSQRMSLIRFFMS